MPSESKKEQEFRVKNCFLSFTLITDIEVYSYTLKLPFSNLSAERTGSPKPSSL